MENDLLLNITGSDNTIRDVIGNAIQSFHKELQHYIGHNQDFNVLEYSNEQSLASMLVLGLIRKDARNKNVSALQEYGCEFEAGSYGRPDIFLRIEDTAFYIECKYDKTTSVRKDHWDIEGWLEWDTKTIYNQVINYCKSEKRNDSYKGGCYVVTMVFKLINDIDNSHREKIIENNFLNISESIGERNWYYSYTTNIYGDNTKGLEIYGTFEKVGSNSSQSSENLTELSNIPIKKTAKLNKPIPVEVEKSSSTKAENVFFLPDSGNLITQNDIDNGVLRITANADINFRRVEENINIKIDGQNFNAHYKPRQDRSDLLRIGKPAMKLLGIKAGGKIKFTKLVNNSFMIAVVP